MITKEEILGQSNSREPRWVHFLSIRPKIKMNRKERV